MVITFQHYGQLLLNQFQNLPFLYFSKINKFLQSTLNYDLPCLIPRFTYNQNPIREPLTISKYKYLMTIIDFLELPNHKILAIDSNGILNTWPKELDRTQGIHQSQMQWPITHYRPISLLVIDQQIIVITTHKQIIFVTAASIGHYSHRYQHRQNQLMSQKAGKSNRVQEKNEMVVKRIQIQDMADEIQCASMISNSQVIGQLMLGPSEEMVDEQQQNNNTSAQMVIYGTKKGLIYLHPFVLAKQQIQFCQIHESVKRKLVFDTNAIPKYPISHNQPDLASNSNPVSAIKGLLPFREDSLMIVALSMPRLFILNLVTMEIIDELINQLMTKDGVENIESIYHNPNFINKFYTLHHSYFIQWSLQLLKCEGYFKHKNIKRILTTDKVKQENPKSVAIGSLFMTSNSSTILCDQLPSIKEQKPSKMVSNLALITQIKQLSRGRIGVCGSYGMIEILVEEFTEMLLFTQ